MSEALSAPGPADALSSRNDQSVTCKVYHHGRPSGSVDRLADISEILKEEGSVVWLDVVDPGPNDLALLQQEFDLHPLAVEDAIKAHQRPKIESYGHYWFLVVQGTTLTTTGVVFHEIAVFAGRNFLVTVRDDPPYPLEEIEQRWHAHPERLRSGGGFLLYTILDTIVDGYFPVAERLETRVDEIEEHLFRNRPIGHDLLPEIFAMKKDGQAFRRAALPMRDVLNPIIRGDVDLFTPEEIVYYRDVYDHAVRVIDQLDALRDLVNSALEIHLSVVANRQNEVSRQLTIIATIFLPLSFLVGFFGQNFSFLVGHIAGPAPFWWLGIGTEVLAVIILAGYFKRRRWF